MSLHDPHTSLQAFVEHDQTDWTGDGVTGQLVTVMIERRHGPTRPARRLRTVASTGTPAGVRAAGHGRARRASTTLPSRRRRRRTACHFFLPQMRTPDALRRSGACMGTTRWIVRTRRLLPSPQGNPLPDGERDAPMLEAAPERPGSARCRVDTADGGMIGRTQEQVPPRAARPA